MLISPHGLGLLWRLRRLGIVVAAARVAAGTGGPRSGPELASLQRALFAVRTALVGAVAVLDADRCAAAVDRVDELADGLLKRS